MIASDIRRLALCASILLFASVLSPTACRAADASGRYMIFSHGVTSCGRFLSEENELIKSGYDGWLAGYLSAFNVQTPGVNNILEGTDLDGAIAWVKNYCQQFPTDAFKTAASKLTEFMMLKRLNPLQ
jgi:hypothetical protein